MDRPADRSPRDQWVDGDEPGLMAGVMRLHLLASSQLEAVAEAHGIPLADYLVLAVVRRSPDGRTSPGAICDVLHRTSGGMTLTLDRLAAAGWLERSPDPRDRRKVVLALTPSGRDLAVAVNDALHDWERSLDLSPDRLRDVLAVVDEISGVLEHAEHPPALL
jgi:DNA-binding MarR family transcriptional regulator